jgi:signal peptidase I
MNLWGFFRSKSLPILLALTIILSASTFFVFLRLDLIVHGDLYNYGLIYSDEWAVQYWAGSAIFQSTIDGVIAVAIIGLLVLLLYNKTENIIYRWAGSMLSFLASVLAIRSLFIFLNLNSIVHNTLYEFSLNFNIAWSNPYWTYANAIVVFMGLCGGIGVLSGLLFIFEGNAWLQNREQAVRLIQEAKQNRFSIIHHSKLYRKILYLAVIGLCLITDIFILVFYRPMSLGGNTRYEPILTGSMEPSLPVGSLVIISPVDTDSLQVGNIICYRFSDSMLITHRIINITSEGFQTKGDANEEPDRDLITQSQIVGSVVLSVPVLGYLGPLMQTPVGFMLLLIIPASIVIGCEIKTIKYGMKKIKRANSNQQEVPN